MDKPGRKSSLKKLKSKVMAKLFGQTTENDVSDDLTAQEGSATAPTSSSSPLSGLDTDVRAHEVRVHGSQCCPTGTKQGHFSEPVHTIGSSSYLSDDEGSGSDLALKKSKRKKRRFSSESRKQAQQPASSSSSGSAQATLSTHQTSEPSAQAGSNLTKTHRRKLKKKQPDQEERFDSGPYTEFTLGSAGSSSE